MPRETRTDRIAAVVDAWENLGRERRSKAELMVKHPELYSAISWLVAYETVTVEKRRRKKRRWWRA